MNFLDIGTYIAYYYLAIFSIFILRKLLFSNASKSLMIILGSGGHTGEMLLMIKKLDFNKFSEVYFLTSSGDLGSKNRTISNLDVFKNCNKVNDDTYVLNKTIIKFESIVRSRQVGQSYFTSLFTTILSLIHSVYLVLKCKVPNLVSLKFI